MRWKKGAISDDSPDDMPTIPRRLSNEFPTSFPQLSVDMLSCHLGKTLLITFLRLAISYIVVQNQFGNIEMLSAQFEMLIGPCKMLIGQFQRVISQFVLAC